jgi:hypothetical protein
MMFLIYRLPPALRVILICLGASCFVFVLSLTLQWFVYDEWLHRVDPLRITGTLLASMLTFVSLWRWQVHACDRRRQLQRRLDVVREMNDKIRNALQIIEVTSYVSQPNATAAIREAVDTIDAALREGSAFVVPYESDMAEELSLARR